MKSLQDNGNLHNKTVDTEPITGLREASLYF